MSDVPRRRLLEAAAAASATVLAGCSEMSLAENRRAADTVVSTTADLEAVFSTLNSGETVFIDGTNAPYRIGGWLDIDVDGVTVIGPGIRELIKPAAGANAGGIRIGHHSHCEEIDIRGIGFHGYPSGQSGRAKRCHGIIVRDAANITIERNTITRTHPYHEHNSGGSGISAQRQAKDVRILNNHIYDIGDRGVQVGGENITIRGNVIVDGFDRSVSLDAWSPTGINYQARNVAVTGNVMGDNPEGSLTGVGAGNQGQTDRGYYSIVNNVGFGEHKSLCHVGFDGQVKAVTVADNVSVQDGDRVNAGVSINMSDVSQVAVRNNALYEYNGRGINVAGDIRNFHVVGNGIYAVSEVGIRIVNGRDGTIRGNDVKGTGAQGLVLNKAQAVHASGNRFRDTAGAGILTRDSNGHTAIDNNYVQAYGQGGGSPPGILLKDKGNLVRWNRIQTNADAGPAILEGDTARANLFQGNWASGDRPWAFRDPTSVVRGNTPGVDIHRDLVPQSGSVEVTFDTRYSRPPKLAFGRRAGGIEGITYVSDGEDNVTGARIDVADSAARLDLFVEGRR